MVTESRARLDPGRMLWKDRRCRDLPPRSEKPMSVARRLFVILTFVASSTILLGGCASVLEQVQGLTRPSARIDGVSISSISLEALTLDFDVVVENPASVPLPLLDLAYELQSADRTFLSGTTGVSGSVPAKGERRIGVPVSVDLVEAVRVLSGVRPGAIVPYRASLDLSVDAPALGRITLPLRHESELPVPSVPTVDVESIQWAEVSFSRVMGTVRLGVRNPNDFSLQLDSLTGGLRLGGRSVADLSAAPAADLGRGASTVVELPLIFAPLDLGAGLLDLVRGSDSRYELEGRLQMDTRFGAFTLPYSSGGTVPFLR